MAVLPAAAAIPVAVVTLAAAVVHLPCPQSRPVRVPVLSRPIPELARLARLGHRDILALMVLPVPLAPRVFPGLPALQGRLFMHNSNFCLVMGH